MKQTAVEFLTEFIENNQYFIGNDLYEAMKQAKAMEKEQIIDAYKEGCFDNILDEKTDKVRAEQYYNENYGKK